jgi:CheY-like chemotaxis protein
MPNVTTFLYVEDDMDSAFFAKRVFNSELRHLGFQTVSDGAQARDYVARKGAFADRQAYPCADVILLDLDMPRMDGFEFLQWVRSKNPDDSRHIPVVVFTSSDSDMDISRAYALGANAYVVKASQFKDFEQQIRTVGHYWADLVTGPTPRENE